jgi:HlyD family secretion protein
MKISLPYKTLPIPRSLLALILVGLLGAGGFFAVRSQTQQRPQRASRAMTAPAKVEDLNVRIQASGKVVPVQSVNVSPKSSGRLVALFVDQGDRVQQGQIIARMEDQDWKVQMAEAEARLAQAQAQLLQARNGTRSEEVAQAQARVEAAQVQAKLAAERTVRNRNLFQEGAISRDQYDGVVAAERQAEADLQVAQKSFEQSRNGTRPEEIAAAAAAVAQAEAQVEASQVQLNDTVLRAPFSGVVTQKYASVGAFVTPTTSASATSSATSTSIVALASTLEIVANVPESSVSQIKPGQKVEIKADAYSNQTFRGKVRLVAPEAVVEQNITSFQVRVALETGQTQLKSGMNVSLTFLGSPIKNAIVIPAVALVTEKGQTGVLIPNGEQPRFRPVTPGVVEGDQVQIVQGLKPGEQVFVYVPRSPQQRRNPGSAIRFR